MKTLHRLLFILLALSIVICAWPTGIHASEANPARDYWPTSGWREASPAEQGMNGKRLQSLFKSLGRRKVDGIVVTRHGYLVAEKYWDAYGPEVPHPVFSCTKSVASTLIALTREQGLIQSVNQPLTDFFPEWLAEGVDPRKKEVTLQHVLTMTSGIDWPEGNYAAPDNVVAQWTRSSDWVQFVLDRPLDKDPGTKFNYSTGASHLLTAIVNRATGKTPLEMADEYIFAPLGISSPAWQTDPAGVQCGGYGLQLTPRDMAKFGYLFLNRGCWEGRQLVPEAWVDEATVSHVQIGPLGYGYQWWVLKVPGRDFDAFAALGLGGQQILVIPKLDIVAAVTANNPTDVLLVMDCLKGIARAAE